jgi:single-stranded-DNA-specific exonuclease
MAAETRWIHPEPVDVPTDFAGAVGGHPLVAETLYRRGITTPEAAQAFLDPRAYSPAPPEDLPDMVTACGILADVIHVKGRILIWGDFDVDGQTATTLLVEGLRSLGANPDYHIPVRGKESHGITPSVLESYLAQGFDLLLTCDTGITEHENIARVQDAGHPVIVTDHHTLGETLPSADAVVNPQRLPADHPLRSLPGVGVAFKLIEGLYRFLGKPFEPGPALELAALGIVADIAELQGDTRYLLQKGLGHLRHTRRLGLQTLMQMAGVNPLNLNEGHIGFQIAPRMNAIGRLADANPVVELLTTQDRGRARVLATQIEALNAKRRFLTRQVAQAAEKQLQSSPEDRRAPALVLHHPEWPGGVVGIVAGQLAERYQKPVILLTGEGQIHGSARSTAGVNIIEAIRTQSHLLAGFGGHPMAAGLSLPEDRLSAFKHGFWEAVRDRMRGRAVVTEVPINSTLSLDEISLPFIEEINRLGPFGPSNPPLHFLIPDLAPVSDVTVGQNGEHKQVIAEDEAGNRQRFIWWNGGDQPAPEAAFDLVCKLHESDFQGERQVSAEWVDFQLSEKGAAVVASRHFTVIDHRDDLRPGHTLKRVLAENPDALVWAEGPEAAETGGVPRHELTQTPALILWTAPPADAVLRDMLRQAAPQKLIVFGLSPGLAEPRAFLQHLGGLAKFAISHRAGRAALNLLAGACAASEEAVRVGLQWWAARGVLTAEFEAGFVHLSMAKTDPDSASLEILQAVLADLLAEARAYRAFFRSGQIESLFPEMENAG